MAKILEIDRKKHDVGLYDSDTGEHCVTEKVVDITEDCPKGHEEGEVLLLFTRAKRGRIVQVRFGAQIHFFVDELDKEMSAAPKNDTFGLMADRLGLTKVELRQMIEEYVPAK